VAAPELEAASAALGRAIRLPPQSPLTDLRQLAGDIARFADALEAESDLDARVFRYWQTRLLGIAAELESMPRDDRGRR
jgi:hypothetical protein